MEKLTAVIRPDHVRTQLLVRCGAEEVLKAVLPSPTPPHWRAAPTLLEGLALWFQQPVGIVLALDDLRVGTALGLCDEFGFGQHTIHFHVEVRRRVATRLRRSLRLDGRGDFRQLRRQLLRVAP
jgi:hypothetical protein